MLFGAIFAPVLAAAIHGVLATAEYTKVAESSKEAADRLASLFPGIMKFPAGDEQADPSTLLPIQEAITAFTHAAVNEASGWRAIFRDKNIPLA